MKKRIGLFWGIILWLASIQVHAEAIELLRVAGDQNYPPYEFVDKKGVYRGLNVDIMKAVSDELGIDFEITPMRWADAADALERGDIDVIQGMTYTALRGERFLFSDPLVQNIDVLFVGKETHNISDLAGLVGLPVSVQKGDINEELIDQMVGVEVLKFDTQEAAINALLSGKVRAFLGNRITSLYYLQTIGKTESVKIVGDPLKSSDYCSVTMPENEEIIHLLNKGISRIKSNGVYDQIYRKWFGEIITDHMKAYRTAMVLIGIILGVALVVIFIINRINKTLSRIVEERTMELKAANLDLLVKQADLEQSNRLRGSILENTLDGIVAFDFRGKVLASNVVSSMYIPQIDQSGNGIKTIEFGNGFLERGYDQVLSGEIFHENLELVSESGRVLFLDCAMIPVTITETGIEGFLLTIHDYTESRELKDALYNDDKMRALGNLTAGISHEIRNPLTAMKAFIDMLPHRFEDLTFREQFEVVLKSEVNRLYTLTDSLLAYAQPRKNQCAEFLIDQCIGEVLDLFSLELTRKRIRQHVTPQGLTVYADALQVKHVLINVLFNSIEAIGENGDVFITTSSDRVETCIEIKDTGCGMSGAELARVFEPFYTTKPSGTGLGLSICYELIRSNHGKISMYSEPAQGTVTVIRLLSLQSSSFIAEEI